MCVAYGDVPSGTFVSWLLFFLFKFSFNEFDTHIYIPPSHTSKLIFLIDVFFLFEKAHCRVFFFFSLILVFFFILNDLYMQLMLLNYFCLTLMYLSWSWYSSVCVSRWFPLCKITCIPQIYKEHEMFSTFNNELYQRRRVVTSLCSRGACAHIWEI